MLKMTRVSVATPPTFIVPSTQSHSIETPSEEVDPLDVSDLQLSPASYSKRGLQDQGICGCFGVAWGAVATVAIEELIRYLFHRLKNRTRKNPEKDKLALQAVPVQASVQQDPNQYLLARG